MLSLIIYSIQQLTPGIRRYELRNIDGVDLPLVTAGAHLKIFIPLNNGTHTLQQYSICSDPGRRDAYEIIIQQLGTADDIAYNNFQTGLLLQCETHGNNFQLHADANPALFFAEGIGIAAIKPMAQTLARRGRRLQIHHASSSANEMIFSSELKKEFGRYYLTYAADEEQQWDLHHLVNSVTHNTLFYISGSRALINNIDQITHSLGITKDRIQSEAFLWQQNVSQQNHDRPVVLELVRSNKLIHVNANQPLLAAIRDSGVPVDFDCCVGECGSCAVKIIDGEVDHRDSVLSEAARTEGLMCICVSRAISDKLVLDL